MKRLADAILAQLLRQQVQLYGCCARLAAQTDAEALHDLRIALRQLRSVLRPLRRLPAVPELDAACAALAARSGPARDQQVLAAELQRQGLEASAQRLRQQAEEGCQALLESDELPQLFRVLDGLPPFWRLARREGCLRRLRRRVRHGLARQRAGLRERLQAPEPDWHRLRLQVKQLRYAAQAYPALAGLSSAELELLQRLQAVLGDWHDAQQWLALAERAPELAGCRADWQARQAQAVAQVGPLLDCLGQAWGVPAPAECPAICGLV